jgi:hypothetical protein
MRNRSSSLASLALALGISMLVPASTGAEMTAMQIVALIPEDQTVCEVMIPQTPARLDELTEAIRAATRENPAWWNDYRTNAPEGEPLPYHENLGVTEEEYEEFLSLLGTKTLVKRGEVSLSVTSKDNSIYALNCTDTLATIQGVVIDLDKDRVETPFGTAEEKIYIEASPQQKLTGPWSGVEWKLVEIEDEKATGRVVQLALGKLEESGRGILYYKGSDAGGGMAHGAGPHGGSSAEKVTVILTYPLRGAE